MPGGRMSGGRLSGGLMSGGLMSAHHDKHITNPCDRSRTNSEFDSIRGEYWFFECRKTGSQTESKNRFIRFFPYRYTTLLSTNVIKPYIYVGDVPR